MRRRVLIALERWLLLGPIYRLLLLGGLLTAIALVGGVLAWAFGPIESFPAALWWAVLHLSDSGYLGDDEGSWMRFLGAILTVLGVVVFVGTLVAIMTQWLVSSISRLESGRTPIARRNHVVVLGWSSRTQVVVRELLLSSGRVSRFLAMRGLRDLHVVVLVDADVPTVLRELSERVGASWDPRDVTVRHGSALRAAHLDRVALSDAAVVLVPASRTGEESAIDARTIKILMTASIHVRDIDRADRPLIVAEIVETNKTDLARRAYNGPIEVVSSDVIVSRMIGQCIRHPGIADTYEEILGHEVGAEIYIRKCPTGLAGSPFNQTARWFEQAIPIGIVPNGDGDTVLAPAGETLVSPDDDIVLVAQDYTSSQPSKTPASDSASSSVAEPWRDDERRVQRVLLLGWSRKVPDLLTEFGALEGQLEVHCVSVIETQVRERALLRCGVQLDGLHVVHHEADFVSAADLARIDPSGFDSVAIVANDWVATEQETDARTVLGHMVLRELLDDLPSTERPTVVVELLDSANRELFDGWNGDVIVSSVIVSRMVAHIGMRPKLRGVYDALFRAGGAEFYVRPLREFGIQRAAKFLPEELARIASAHGAIFVGIHTSRTTRLDPPRNERIELRSSDSLVVLAADRADARL